MFYALKRPDGSFVKISDLLDLCGDLFDFEESIFVIDPRQEVLEKIRDFRRLDGYEVTQVDSDDLVPSNECQRCGSCLNDGRCVDETCPFSDHDQTCPMGWCGHPDYPQVAMCNCVGFGEH